MAQVIDRGSATLAELAAGIVSGGIRVVDLTVPLEIGRAHV